MYKACSGRHKCKKLSLPKPTSKFLVHGTRCQLDLLTPSATECYGVYGPKVFAMRAVRLLLTATGAMASPRRDQERKLQHDSFDRMGKHLHIGLRIWCPFLRRPSVHRSTTQISFTMHAPLHVHVSKLLPCQARIPKFQITT